MKRLAPGRKRSMDDRTKNTMRETTGRLHSANERSGRSALSVVIGVLLPLVVLGGGAWGTWYLVETGPKAQPKKGGGRNARLVEVEVACRSDVNTTIKAMGTVKPALQIDLQPRVAGEVIEVSEDWVPGRLYAEGELILRIDPTDYDLIVRQQKSDVAKVKSLYRLEVGNQTIAKSEYELLGETIREEDRDLVLRKPQLQSVEAAMETARAALAKAELDLARAEVRSPFNAIVVTGDAKLGAQVSAATRLARLVGTDEYWVELSLPVDQLKWIEIPRGDETGGSLVRVFDEAAWGEGVQRLGHVIRLAGDLEEEGRMARVFAAVADPLALGEENAGAPRLLIGSFVSVEIEGRTLDDVIALDRELLRDGDRVWVLSEEGTLEIRDVTVAFRGRGRVLISSGVEEGEMIVATDLSAPVGGMPLRTVDEGER